MSEEDNHSIQEHEEDIEVNTEEQKDYLSKEEIQLHESAPMLADEEMPSYISVVSGEDYNIQNIQQALPTSPLQAKDNLNTYVSDNDQDEDSVYVVSSREGSERPTYDDEEDGYEDSDDQMNDEDEDEDPEDEEEDEDVEDEDEDEEDEDEVFDGIPNHRYNDITDAYDPEDYTDDDAFSMKRNKHLGTDGKLRSLSLQDLSNLKGKDYTSPRTRQRSLDILKDDHIDYPVENFVHSTSYKRQPSSLKYNHVQSKVKHYIHAMKERSRQSMERRLAKAKSLVDTNQSPTLDPLSGSPKNAVITDAKMIKSYAKKLFRELVEIEECEIKKVKDLENGNDITTVEPEIDDTTTIERQAIQMEENCEKIIKPNDKIDDCNGIMEIDSEDPIPAVKNSFRESCLPNGHESAPTIYHMQPMSYEEYMHNNSISTDQRHDACPLKIAHVQSVPMNLDNILQGLRRVNQESNANRFSKTTPTSSEMEAKNAEITMLKMQLNEKNVQLDTLKEDHQKTISENVKMKQELELLRKALKEREKENQPRPVQVAAVQTEPYIEPESIKAVKNIPATEKSSNSSLGTGSSSIERWPESSIEQITDSTSTSLKPPELEINSSSSSYITGVPKNIQFSKSFITSSRILQTLSNITQRKINKIDTSVSNTYTSMTSNENNNVNSNKQAKEDSNSMVNQSPYSKKRKATEMMEHGNLSQPFKIPHTGAGHLRKSINTDDNSPFKRPESLNKSKNSFYVNSGSLKDDEMHESFQSTDIDDNIKFFVYREDEKSEDQSFLIQATEPKRKSIDENRVQECGPYLLGNVEIRMSEVNGLINIWGKEVSSESLLEEDEQTKIPMRTNENDVNCENTPNTSSHRISCSTLKRSKLTPRFDSYSLLSRISDLRDTTLTQNLSETQYPQIPCNPNFRVHSCNPIDSSKHKVFSNHPHSDCCDQHVQTKDCHCQTMEERTHNICPKFKQNPLENQKCLGRNCESDYNPCSRGPRTEFLNEDVRRHSKHDRSCCQNVDENETHPKCCNHSNDNNVHHSSTSMHHGSCSCKNKSSNDDEQAPLLSPNETSETRQRRLRGKRVRGILMDFLRGCGDCRTSDPCSSRDNKSNPYMKKTTMKASPSGSCSSNKSKNPANDRCCRDYANNLESELEQVRAEVEKLRSRSDDILEMLKTLYSLDVN